MARIGRCAPDRCHVDGVEQVAGVGEEDRFADVEQVGECCDVIDGPRGVPAEALGQRRLLNADGFGGSLLVEPSGSHEAAHDPAHVDM